MAIAILFLGTISAVQASEVATSSTVPAPGKSDLKSAEASKPSADFYGRLLNPDTPLQERQAEFAKLEDMAQRGDPTVLYIVGSLYRIGNALPASPVARDLAKARLYLSNAATHGTVLAMAKMAELEVTAGNPLEAMTWAQIYAHYAMLQPPAYRPSEGYLAELVERASLGVSKSQLQDVVDHLNAFIATYDGQVRSGSEKTTSVSSDLVPIYIPNSPMALRPGDRMPPAGFADYLVSFAPHGHVKDILLMDATPDMRLGAILRSSINGYRVGVAPSSANSSLRYTFIPVIFDDGKYRLAPKSSHAAEKK